MAFRNLDGNHDWTFGLSKNNYVTENKEIALNIKTRVLSFIGDCFFAPLEGINWWELLEYNKRDEIELEVMNTIANTDGVVEIINIDTFINSRREQILSYNVKTVYDEISNEITPIIL